MADLWPAGTEIERLHRELECGDPDRVISAARTVLDRLVAQGCRLHISQEPSGLWTAQLEWTRQGQEIFTMVVAESSQPRVVVRLAHTSADQAIKGMASNLHYDQIDCCPVEPLTGAASADGTLT
jgi:hypothetical protein